MGEDNDDDGDDGVEDACEEGVEDGLNVWVGEVGVDDVAGGGKSDWEEAIKGMRCHPDLK